MTKRVGHRGAHAVVRGNTLGSFEAALDLGVDMIEFDVCAVRGRLGIAHNPLEGRLLGCLALETGLAHLAAPRFHDIELNVDLKRAVVSRPSPAGRIALAKAPTGGRCPRGGRAPIISA
jgi:glycerophosphoryl diester phosphodiesterase